jgi:hypothetical protein
MMKHTAEQMLTKLEHETEAHPKDGKKWAEFATFLQSNTAKALFQGKSQASRALSCFYKAAELAHVAGDRKLEIFVRLDAGLLLSSINRPADSLHHFDRAFQISNHKYDWAHSLYLKGRALHMLGRKNAAATTYLEALDYFPLHSSLIASHAELGLEFYRDDHDFFSHHSENIEYAMGQEIPPETPTHLGSIFTDDSFAVTEKAIRARKEDLPYAAAWVAQHLGEYDKAWAYVHDGHNMAKHLYQRTAQDFQRDIASTKRVFQPTFWPANVGHPSTVPVFLVGMISSGGCLLEHMLDSHPSIKGIGDDSSFNEVLPYVREEIVQAMASNLDEEGKYKEVRSIVMKHGNVILENMIAKATDNNSYSEEEKNQRSMFDLGGILGESDANNHKYLVDRLVYNFRNVGLIHLIFPNATIIHITRDPMDSLIGTYFHKPDTGSEWTSDFGQTVDYFGAYLEIMNHWESVLPGRIVEVQYEALVFKPHETMGKLLENLGLKSESDQYTPVCTRPSLRSAVLSYRAITEEADPATIGRWKEYSSHLGEYTQHINATLSRLYKARQLPFWDTVNWAIDPKFDYCDGVFDCGPESRIDFDRDDGTCDEGILTGSTGPSASAYNDVDFDEDYDERVFGDYEEVEWDEEMDAYEGEDMYDGESEGENLGFETARQ